MFSGYKSSVLQVGNILEIRCTEMCVYLTLLCCTVHLKIARMVNFVLCIFLTTFFFAKKGKIQGCVLLSWSQGLTSRANCLVS